MEGGKAVVLLNCFVSQFGNRVKIALARNGVAYEEKSENLAAKSPLLPSSNSVHGKIPVLLVDGKPVCESLVILEFIDEAFPGEPLLPTDPFARAQARSWASYIDAKGHCHPKVFRALIEQAQRLTLSSRAFYNDKFPIFAEYLTSMFGYEMLLPMNTGAEGFETAIKLARKWGYEKKKIPNNKV